MLDLYCLVYCSKSQEMETIQNLSTDEEMSSIYICTHICQAENGTSQAQKDQWICGISKVDLIDAGSRINNTRC